MAAKTGRSVRRLTIRTRIASEAMPAADLDAAERIVARLVARAYAAEHPELFGPRLSQIVHTEDSGPPAAAAAVTGAPPASAGGPGKMELEQGVSKTVSRR